MFGILITATGRVIAFPASDYVTTVTRIARLEIGHGQRGLHDDPPFKIIVVGEFSTTRKDQLPASLSATLGAENDNHVRDHRRTFVGRTAGRLRKAWRIIVNAVRLLFADDRHATRQRPPSQ